jgi:shikimate dehydrogenase
MPPWKRLAEPEMQHTFAFGLIGWPLEHSLSPVIHQAALEALGINGVYSLYPISPGSDSQFREVLDLMHNEKLDGLNVTIPYKQQIIPQLDFLAPYARATGAVNTIYRRGSQLFGDNTDVSGFFKALGDFLEENPVQSSQQAQPHALILGAGGAARAVAYALMRHGWSVTLAARRLNQAQDLVGTLDGLQLTGKKKSIDSCLNAVPLQAQTLAPIVKTVSLIVNATPLGMGIYADQSPWPAATPFPQQAALFDLVYNPAETVLMRSARASGMVVTNGLGMLVEQAALAFEIWTGQPAPRSAMYAALRSEHGGQNG